MDARRLITIFSDQKEELLSHDLSLLCDRMEERQLSPSSNLAQIVTADQIGRASCRERV